MTVSSQERTVRDVVDSGGMYFSRAASAGGYIFLSVPPVDSSGRLAAAAAVKAPYRLSPAAQSRAQSQYVLESLRDMLDTYGASMADVVQVEQYTPHKAYADSYIEVSRGPGFLDTDRPNSALMATGDLIPQGSVIVPMAVAVVPTEDRRKELYSTGLHYPKPSAKLGPSYSSGPPYSEIVAAGPYIFTTLIAADYRDVDPSEKIGVHPDAMIDQWVWWGSEIRAEARFNIDGRLRPRMDVVESGIDQAIHCTVYLTEIEDLYDLDLVWKEAWPTDPPTRTVVPVRGLGMPRREGPTNHGDGAVKMEAMFQLIRPGHGAEKQIIDTGRPGLGHESEAIKAGPLLWTSGLMAADEDGPVGAPHIAAQVEHVFGRLEDICEAAGTDMSNLLRVRAYVTEPSDGYAIYDALKKRVPDDPPCVCITGVPAPLQVPEAKVILDAVAYVPE